MNRFSPYPRPSERGRNRSFSLGVLAEREAACVVCLDTPPKQRLLYAWFGPYADKKRSDQVCYLRTVRTKKQQAVFRRGIQADDASRFSFCSQTKYTEGKASIYGSARSMYNMKIVQSCLSLRLTDFLLTFPKRMAEVPDARVLDRGTILTC